MKVYELIEKLQAMQSPLAEVVLSPEHSGVKEVTRVEMRWSFEGDEDGLGVMRDVLDDVHPRDPDSAFADVDFDGKPGWRGEPDEVVLVC